MNYTTKLALRLPESSEAADIVDLNYNAGVIDAKLGAAPGIINLGWKKLQEYLTAGTYTWVAPDLFGGASYVIGVLIVGGGESGKAADIGSSYSSVLNGGASGFSKALLLTVTPGTSYPVIIGAGGAKSYNTTSNAGGSSSFNGNTVYGGGGSDAGKNIGAESPITFPGNYGYNDTRITGLKPFGGAHISVLANTTYPAFQSYVDPGECIDPFSGEQILGAGGTAFTVSGGTVCVTAGGKNASGYGGGNAVAGAAGEGATLPGCGGGSCSSASAGAGKGADGAVKIYVRGVSAA